MIIDKFELKDIKRSFCVDKRDGMVNFNMLPACFESPLGRFQMTDASGFSFPEANVVDRCSRVEPSDSGRSGKSKLSIDTDIHRNSSITINKRHENFSFFHTSTFFLHRFPQYWFSTEFGKIEQ